MRLPSWAAFTFYNEDAVRRLDGYFKRDGFKTDHLAPPYDAGTFKRRWYGMPRGFTGQWVLFYNRRSFSAAGVRPPAGDWTWDDFLRTARELTRPAAGTSPAQWGTALEPLADFYYPWLWGSGGEDIERNGEKSLLDQPAAREALQWLHDLRHKHVEREISEVVRSLGALRERSSHWNKDRTNTRRGPHIRVGLVHILSNAQC